VYARLTCASLLGQVDDLLRNEQRRADIDALKSHAESFLLRSAYRTVSLSQLFHFMKKNGSSGGSGRP
jgi:hypothetical protein